MKKAKGFLVLTIFLILITINLGKWFSKATALPSVPDSIILGTFKVENVIDGDTITVYGLNRHLRLLGIDTEETFKDRSEQNFAEKNFEAYLRSKMRGRKFPKFATPFGEKASDFVASVLENGTKVRLEFDTLERVRDFYGRYLVYVFMKRGETEILLNVELVRLGYTPYFTKYGKCIRYHKEFLKAQDEARHERHGIWDPKEKHYPDYPERIKWWNHYADNISEFREEHE